MSWVVLRFCCGCDGRRVECVLSRGSLDGCLFDLDMRLVGRLTEAKMRRAMLEAPRVRRLAFRRRGEEVMVKKAEPRATTLARPKAMIVERAMIIVEG